MVSTPYKLQEGSKCYHDHYNSYASKQLASYEYWIAKSPKIFTLQISLIRASIFDLYTDDSNPDFQSVNKKRVHHET